MASKFPKWVLLETILERDALCCLVSPEEQTEEPLWVGKGTFFEDYTFEKDVSSQ